ncbi:hypothetical protein M2322_000654 [Rhodoblastus acidophilus]|nr:hypothetical protein [Rhodoblastus acidophilus]
MARRPDPKAEAEARAKAMRDGFADYDRRRCKCGAKFPPFGVSGTFYCRPCWRAACAKESSHVDRSARQPGQGALF